MNKVIGEFLSNQQPYPQFMATVVYKVGNRTMSSCQSKNKSFPSQFMLCNVMISFTREIKQCSEVSLLLGRSFLAKSLTLNFNEVVTLVPLFQEFQPDLCCLIKQ